MKCLYKFIVPVVVSWLTVSTGVAQEKLVYQQPPEPIAKLVDAPTIPSVKLNGAKTWMVVLGSERYVSLESVAKPILGLAGLRIDPDSRTRPSATRGFHETISITNLKTGAELILSGLPSNLRFANLTWHRNGNQFAFTNETPNGLELWLADLNTGTARKLFDGRLNALTGRLMQWSRDGKFLLVQVPANDGLEAPREEAVPFGPVVRENFGRRTRSRTFQNLLGNAHDEVLLDFYAESQLVKVYLDGRTEKFGQPAIFSTNTLSPDGKYLFVQRVVKPYSYAVPLRYFPEVSEIWDENGERVTILDERRLVENTARFIARARSFQWRRDKPSELVWVKRASGRSPYPYDIFSLSAPFQGEARVLYRTETSFAGIVWGNSEYAIVQEHLRSSRAKKWSLINPETGALIKVIEEGQSDDRFSDPGSFVRSGGKMRISGDKDAPVVYTIGDGASAEGDRPFLLRWNLLKDQRDTLFKSSRDFYEKPISFNGKETLFFTRESANQPPNMVRLELTDKKENILTNFANPYAETLGNITKKTISYKREDGVTLWATLYLPEGFEQGRDQPLPALVWAYPRDYRSVEAAEQIVPTLNKFGEFNFRSPVYWVTRGYAVVEGAAMPILAEDDGRPNDVFVSQLTMNATALIDYLAENGIADRNRIGVGGHSYGAFMTANLLAHTDLFAAGIARSGAYNRTLTPFGFQAESRNYWAAKEVYDEMSPFTYANKIKTPILITHGSIDENSGTYPVQSERFFDAIKGHGGTARLVMFPYEFHGFRTNESILHVLWEQDQWLEKHVKNKK